MRRVRPIPSPPHRSTALPENGMSGSDVRIGCSGWSYPHWRKRFIGKSCRRESTLPSTRGTSAPSSSTILLRQPRETIRSLREQAPPNFLFGQRQPLRHPSSGSPSEQESIDLVVDAHSASRKNWDRSSSNCRPLPRGPGAPGAFRRHAARDLRFTLEFRHDSWLVPPSSSCSARTASRSAYLIIRKCPGRSRSRATSHI